MKAPASIYTHCDELDNLPEKNRKNWLFESAYLTNFFRQNESVLQIGCANCSRLIDLKRKRADVTFLGIDIEQKLLNDATKALANEQLDIETRLCDLTSVEAISTLGHFDTVICLNNTLGYIPDEAAALKNMRALGKRVVISVYGEAFTDDDARAYFSTLGLTIKNISENRFTFDDFTSVKRYTRQEIEGWKGTIEETPLGYLCIL